MIDSFLQVLLWTCPLFVIYYFYSKSKKENEEIDIIALKVLFETTHNVTVENHSGMEYWFDTDTNKFIAQGATRADIISVLKSRWARHIFIINHEEIVMGPSFKSIIVSNQ